MLLALPRELLSSLRTALVTLGSYALFFLRLLAVTPRGLLRVTAPARVATHAFVNPVVAVLLGAVFAGEPLSARVLVAGGIIVVAVALITWYGAERQMPPKRHRAGEGLEVHEAP